MRPELSKTLTSGTNYLLATANCTPALYQVCMDREMLVLSNLFLLTVVSRLCQTGYFIGAWN